MAESLLKKLDDHVQCAICLSTYNNPKVLQCHHVFCCDCLSKILRSKHGLTLTSLECPSCREETQLYDGGVDSLQSAFHMSGVLQIRTELNMVENLTTAFQSLPEGLNISAQESAQPSVSSLVTCSDHENEEVKLYCESCGMTICFLCAISGGKHQTHQYCILSDAYMKYESDIRASVKSLDDGCKEIMVLLEQVDTKSNNIREQEVTMKKRIDDNFQELHDFLNAQHAELEGNFREVMHGRLKMLSARKDEIETVQAKATQCHEMVVENLEMRNEGAILKMKEKIMEQVNELLSLLPPNCPTFDVEAPKLVLKSFRDFSSSEPFGKIVVSGSPDPLKCYVTAVAGSLEKAEVGSKSVIILHVIDTCGGLCTEDILHACVCEVVSDTPENDDMGLCLVSVTRVAPGEYELSYIPAICGSSKVHVKINGDHIQGSPFNIVINLSEEAQVQTIKDVCGPLDITMCRGSEKMFVVTGSGSPCVYVCNSIGQQVCSFGKPGFGKGYLNKPCGIAIDENGDIVVADYFNSRILKFNLKGDFITSVGTKGCGPLKFDYPRAVAFNPFNKRVYTIDNNSVQILKTDFSYITSFGKQGHHEGQFSTPGGIACDKFGNIYVADSGNHRIQVFNSVGKFLISFGSRGNLEGELAFPVAVSINGDSIYVSENKNHRVSVFTTNGKFLSFLKKETDQAFHWFNSPRGVAIDKDGVCYVCDDPCIVQI